MTVVHHMQVQNSLLLSAKIDLELPPPDLMHLLRTAAEELRSDALFGRLREGGRSVCAVS